MDNDAAFDDASPVAVVGAGAVGTALAQRLADRGVPVRAILSHDPDDAQALAGQVGAPVASADGTALPAEVRLVMLCVPDDAIPDVAEALAAVAHPWERTVVGHTAGARPATVLDPLARKGAATLSFHPLQTFTAATAPAAFEDIVVGIEGAPAAVAAGKALARTLGARPVELTAQGKALYHCAAALAANGLVALMGVVEEVLAAADGPDDASAATLMAPLVEQTWTNLTTGSPEGALTGPVARGDADTIEAHLQALRDEAPHLLPLYAALSTEMTRLAVRGGQLDGDTAEALLQMLQTTLQSSTDDPPSSGSSH